MSYQILNIEVCDLKVVWVHVYTSIEGDRKIYELCRTNDYGCGLWTLPCTPRTTAEDNLLWSGGSQQLGTDQFNLRVAARKGGYALRAKIRDACAYIWD